MAPPLFKDIGKDASDLLNKGYPSSYEIKTETTSTEGLALNTKVVRTPGAEMKGELNPKYSVAQRGVKLSATITTSKALDVEVSKTDAVVKGLKATFKGKAPAFDAPGKESLTLSTEYKADRVTVTSSLDLVAPKTPSGGVSLVVPYNKLLLGVDVAYALGAAPDVKKVDAVIAYGGGGVNITAFRKWNSSGATYGGSFFHCVPTKAPQNALRIGAELKHAPASGRQPDLAVGAAFKVDNGDVKVKVGTSGRVGLGYATRINAWSKVQLGLDVNSADTRDHKLGFSMTLHD